MTHGEHRPTGGSTAARLAVAVLTILSLLAGAVSASSQERRYYQRERPQGLFNFLFGDPLPRRDGRPPRRVERRGQPPAQYDPDGRYGERSIYQRRARPERAERPRARRPRPVLPTVEPEVSVVEKAPDARTILVVGDFIGGGLAEGLDEAFAETPGVRVVERTQGSSGFVREDVFDWPDKVGAIVDEEKPAAVVVMLGSNDRQQMSVDGKREPKLSPAWVTEYEKRTEALGAALKEKGVPFFWVGMPSFKPSTMTSDMLAFNDIYREAAAEAGGEFIDIWDGFVDEAGAFTTTGPDIAGQPVRLRGSDGINLTKAGKRKVAFYLEKPLSRIVGGKAAPEVAALPGAEAPVQKPLDVNDITRTQPISLADPELDGGTDLLGAGAPRPNPTRTPVDRLVVDGVAGDAKPGRADDFMAGKRPASVAATPSAPAEPTPDPEPTTAIR